MKVARSHYALYNTTLRPTLLLEWTENMFRATPNPPP